MAMKWVLDVRQQRGTAEDATISLSSKDPETGQVLDVITACHSDEEFAAAVEQLKRELDRLVEDARGQWSALNEAGRATQLSPQEAWQQMEVCASEEEMFQYFNSLSEASRREIAEYVFGHVNMFKGRGPVFSEHYDAAAHVLE